MKNLKKILLLAAMVLAVSLPASAQFRFGLKAGVAVNKLSLNQEVFQSDNRAGFTGGVMAEFTVPVVGLGFDASVLYAQRSIMVDNNANGNGAELTKANRGYIDIPVNLKWKIGIPAIGNIITPFLTTGPDFSFLCSKKNVENAFRNRSFDFGWNVGAGLQLVNHVQVAASYCFGISDSASKGESLNGTNLLDGKNRCWTVTLAYIF